MVEKWQFYYVYVKNKLILTINTNMVLQAVGEKNIMKSSFYTLVNILAHKADYNIIFGERSNGKTTAVLEYALKEHVNSN